MWDAFAVGFMNQGLTLSIWVMTSLGVDVSMTYGELPPE